MENILDAQEQKAITKIISSYYMSPVLTEFNAFLEKSNLTKQEAMQDAFNYIYNFMQNSLPNVEKEIDKRIDAGKISDKSQTLKSLAGNVFTSLIQYIFLKNKEIGNIPPNIFITKKQDAIKKFGETFTIYIDEETQKPDCDLIIYNSDNQHIIILSLKTSLRERAGQTYKWKLLLEIANSENTELKEKYNINYNGNKMPIICFATVNFYEEINNPQQRGMFKFFDKAFIAKPNINEDFIAPLSTLISFIEDNL